MYTIRKEFHFSASHSLKGLPKEHPCSNLHGHNYVITVELQTQKLDNVGFVVDYRKLEPIKQFIDLQLDHRHLNDITLRLVNPTAENLAKLIFERFKKDFPTLVAVEVSETPKTTARYTPDHD
jgi:6-pyruvoyltetrahydropterin/6-carboxytetrahydropterin synthase